MHHVAYVGAPRRTLALTTLPLLLCIGLVPRDALAQTAAPIGGPVSGTASATADVAPPPVAAPTPAVTTVTKAPSVATVAAPLSADETADAAVEKEWADRDRKLGESMTLSGGTGLLRTQHAQGGAPGQIRLAFTTEYFSASFLCTREYPCRDPRSGKLVAGDTLNHIGGTLSLGVTFAKLGSQGAFEGYATTGAYANSSDVNRPGLLQVLGDTTFGVKAYSPIAKTLHLGLFAELMLINGTGSVGLSGSGTSARFGPAFTVDLRELDSHPPLRFSANVSYNLDNRGQVVQDAEAVRGTPITRIERFGLNINRVDHLDVNVGAELFLADEHVRPFVEYGLAIPVNRQNYFCKLNNPSGDHCLANDQIAPSKITIGSRFLPWKGTGLSLIAAFDIGVTGVKTFIEETTPTPPWTLFIGAGWAIDTQSRPPTVKTRNVEKIVEIGQSRARIKGLVHEKDKPTGVANAIVSYDAHPEITSMASGPDGRFTTEELPEGIYKFNVRADGYRDAICEATMPKGTQDVTVDCVVDALPRIGTVSGRVRDAETQDAVPNASIKLSTGMAGGDLSLTSDSTGGFRFENVPPGSVTLAVDADNYLAGVQTGDVKVRQDNTIDVQLRHRPKTSLVNIGKTEITIKQAVQFATDSAIILPESFPLLTEVADVFIKNPRIKRVEVQGHTDNTGTPERNKTLSEQRASAVRSWLMAHGVMPDRLVAKGYGQEKPIAPNVTAATKAKNRRVQFVILEQDPATDTKAAPAKADAKKAAPNVGF